MSRGRPGPGAALAVALALVCGGPAPAGAAGALAERAADPAEAIPRFDRAIEQAREAAQSLFAVERMPGLSVAVGYGDSVVWAQGFGVADLDSMNPVTPTTPFRIASVSKLVTAAALGRLWDEGRIALDAPVTRYVPSWPAARGSMTVRQLAGHLGGIRDYRAGDFTRDSIDDRRYETTTQALSIFRRDSLVAPPGARFRYSTLGYTLLAAAMEGASGQDFLSLVRREVLDPLALAHTAPVHPDRPVAGLATGYERLPSGAEVPVRKVTPMYKWAGGGYASTPSDLVRLGLGMLRPGFLAPGTADTLFASQRTNAGVETGVGIGWWTARDPWGRRIAFHNGGQPGARSQLLLYPERGLVISILSNLTNTPAQMEGVAVDLLLPFLRTLEGRDGGTSPAALAGVWRWGLGADTSGVDSSSATLRVSGATGVASVSSWRPDWPARLPLVCWTVTRDSCSAAVVTPDGMETLVLARAGDDWRGRLVPQLGREPEGRPVRLWDRGLRSAEPAARP